MIFHHDTTTFPPFYEPERITFDGERHYLCEGKSYLSVTSLLGRGKVFPDGLENRKRVAAYRGTLLHDALERYLQNQPLHAIPPQIAALYETAIKGLYSVNTIYGIERALFSRIMRLAGTADLLADWNGKLSVIDFKTSIRLKSESEIESYFLQATFYALMIKEHYGIFPSQIVIYMVSEEIDEPLIFVKDSRDYVRDCLRLAKGLKND